MQHQEVLSHKEKMHRFTQRFCFINAFRFAESSQGEFMTEKFQIEKKGKVLLTCAKPLKPSEGKVLH